MRPIPLVIADPDLSSTGVSAGFLNFSSDSVAVFIGSQAMATYLWLFLFFAFLFTSEVYLSICSPIEMSTIG